MDAPWKREFDSLRARGITLAAGLTEAELTRAERTLGVRFPPDLRSFLSTALPIGDEFPDWRAPESSAIGARLGWPLEGILFDIENNDFWWAPWGPRPASLVDAFAVATAECARAPRLIPIYAHRYMPAEPELAGNPVFSVYQTDIIQYGTNLEQYIACEFGDSTWVMGQVGESRRIRMWSDLLDLPR